MTPLLGLLDWHTFFFALFAAIAIVFGVGVLFSGNIVRMAFYLVVSLGATAGLFFLAGAEFIGAMQLMIYVGGTLVLLIFGVMLTAHKAFITMKTRPGELIIAAVLGGSMLLLLVIVAFSVDDWTSTPDWKKSRSRISQFETEDTTRVGNSLVGNRTDIVNEQDEVYWTTRLLDKTKSSLEHFPKMNEARQIMRGSEAGGESITADVDERLDPSRTWSGEAHELIDEVNQRNPTLLMKQAASVLEKYVQMADEFDRAADLFHDAEALGEAAELLRQASEQEADEDEKIAIDTQLPKVQLLLAGIEDGLAQIDKLKSNPTANKIRAASERLRKLQTERRQEAVAAIMATKPVEQPPAELSREVDRLGGISDRKRRRIGGMSGYLLPFEIISIHLLVVLIGAGYLARTKKRAPAVAAAVQRVEAAPVAKRRHWAVTVWLVFLTVVGLFGIVCIVSLWIALASVQSLIEQAVGGQVPELVFPPMYLPLVLGLNVVYLFCLAALFGWHKWGFFGLLGLLIVDFVLSVVVFGVATALAGTIFSAILIGILFFLLRIGRPQSTWEQLE